jgi:hypothetical protein
MKKVKNLNSMSFNLLMCNGIAAGIIWTTANIISIFAVKKSGLGRALSVWNSFVILTSFILGVLLFSESLDSLLLLTGCSSAKKSS